MEHVLLTAGYEVDSAAAAAQSLCMYTDASAANDVYVPSAAFFLRGGTSLSEVGRG
jgi:hypothetical protein